MIQRTGNKQPANPTPRVPVQTPMFDAAGDLTRTWIIFFERLFRGKGKGGGEAQAGAGGPYIRTLLIKRAVVEDDTADHVPVFVEGTAVRLIGVLGYAIDSDLTIRVNMNGTPLITMTLASTQPLDTPVVATAFTPAALGDLAVFTFDITAAPNLTRRQGIATFTLQWATPAEA